MPGRSRAPRRQDAAVEYFAELAAEFVAEIRGAGSTALTGQLTECLLTHKARVSAVTTSMRSTDIGRCFSMRVAPTSADRQSSADITDRVNGWIEEPNTPSSDWVGLRDVVRSEISRKRCRFQRLSVRCPTRHRTGSAIEGQRARSRGAPCSSCPDNDVQRATSLHEVGAWRALFDDVVSQSRSSLSPRRHPTSPG